MSVIWVLFHCLKRRSRRALKRSRRERSSKGSSWDHLIHRGMRRLPFIFPVDVVIGFLMMAWRVALMHCGLDAGRAIFCLVPAVRGLAGRCRRTRGSGRSRCGSRRTAPTGKPRRTGRGSAEGQVEGVGVERQRGAGCALVGGLDDSGSTRWNRRCSSFAAHGDSTETFS